MNLLDWSSLGILAKIFAVIGLTAFVLIVLQAGTSLVGGDVNHDYDITVEDGWMGHTWGLFSVRGFFGFFLGLGWGGLIALQRGFSGLTATLVGVGTGFIIAVALALLMRAINSLRSDGTLKMENAIGRTGTVYQRIPARRGGQGKVQIMVQGRLQTLEAVTDSDTDIAPQQEVQVTSIAAGNLLVVA